MQLTSIVVPCHCSIGSKSLLVALIMAFNQIYPLDVINEASRENISLNLSSTASEVDTSRDCTTDAPLNSLLGLSQENEEEYQELYEDEYQEDSNKAAPGLTVHDFSAPVILPEIRTQSNGSFSDMHADSTHPSSAPSDSHVETQGGDLESGIPSRNASDLDDGGQVNEAVPTSVSHQEAMPPATPSPAKKMQPHSPTDTAPLSPLGHRFPDHADKWDDSMATSSKNTCYGCPRHVLVVLALALIGGLVGVILAMSGGEGTTVTAQGDQSVPSPPDAPTPSAPSEPTPAAPTPSPASPTEPTPDTPQVPDSPGASPTSSAPSSSPDSSLTNPITSPSNPPSHVSPAPSVVPIEPPTISPTASPTASPESQFYPFLADLTPLDVLSDPTTLQGQTVTWLANTLTDPSGYPLFLETDPSYVRQRYAVALLDRATHDGQVTHARFDLNTCDWAGVSCPDGSTLVDKIIWSNQGLVGTLPDELRGLTNVTHLDLGENALSGPLPDGLFDCVHLEYLYLHQNQLTGELSERFADLPALLHLYLGNNQFSGTLPQGFGSPFPRNARDLRPLRTYLVSLPKVSVRRSSDEMLSFYLTGYLSVHHNDLEGPIPEGWNLRFLYYLDLSYNRLNGTLPIDWAEAPSAFNRLKHVFLDHNELTGPVPASYPSMGNGRMELLHLSDNRLTGTMPGGFDPLWFISSMEIQNNNFAAMDVTICESLVFGTQFGEMTNFHADCEICICNFFCEPGVCFNE